MPRSHFPTILGSGAPICSATYSCVQLRCSRSYLSNSLGRALEAVFILSITSLFFSAPTFIRIRDQSYNCLPARGDASIPTPLHSAPAPTRLFDDGSHISILQENNITCPLYDVLTVAFFKHTNSC